MYTHHEVSMANHGITLGLSGQPKTIIKKYFIKKSHFFLF